ncbi:MAG: hypothetical protein JO267_00775 [Alphaproteobacteria bacterium]|nr:hypothetical protein [Alphaproteobacteria bacterium]
MPQFNLKEVDRQLLGAFEAMRNFSPGDMGYNLAQDTLTSKGFSKNPTLPDANETAALVRISDILDQCVRQNDMTVLWNNVNANDPGILYIKAEVTGARKKITLPNLNEMTNRANAPAPPAAGNNVIEQAGSIVWQRVPDANGTTTIVETDTVSKQTRVVADKLTNDQYSSLMAMANQRASNVLVYEQWADAAASAPSPNGPAPTGPTLPDNLPAPGDFSGVDPMMRELMEALQERMGR